MTVRRRTERERQVADLKRFLLRNRWPVRGAAVIGAMLVVTLVLALGLPQAVVHLGEGVRSWAGRSAGLTVRTITISGLDNLAVADVETALALHSGDRPLRH